MISSRLCGWCTSICCGSFSPRTPSEQRQRLGRLAASLDDAVHAQLLVGVVLADLPAAGTAHDDLVVLPPRVVLDLREHFAGVMRVDGLLGRPEDGRVDAGGERHAQRIVRRNGDDARIRADELVEIVRVATDDVVGLEAAQQRGLEHAHTGGHVFGRTIGVVFDVAPLRILAIQNAFEPHRQRSHAHLNEVPGVIDRLR